MIDFIKRNIKKEYQHIRHGLGGFSQDAAAGVGALLSLVTFIASIVIFIVLMSLFVSGDGYENLFDDLFTVRGNAASYYSMPILAILGILNAGMLVVSYVYFFKQEKKSFRIFGAIPFGIVIAALVTNGVFFVLYILGRLDDMDSARGTVIGFSIAGLVAVVASLTMLLLREKEMSRSCLRMLVFSFVIVPLFTLCVQNIALLIIGLLVFILLCVVIHGSIKESGPIDTSSADKTQSERKAPEKAVTSDLTEEQKKKTDAG